MKTIEEEEKKDKVIAFSVAVGVGIVLFLICAFTIVWTPPDPPLPQYGLEVDFGFEELPVDEIITDTKPQETSAAESITTEPIIKETEIEETEIEETESEEEESEESTDFQEDANEELESEEIEDEEVITNPPAKKKPTVVPKKIIENPVVTPRKKPKINMNAFFGDDENEDEQTDNTKKSGNGNDEIATTNITSSLKEKGQPVLNISGGWQWVNIPNEKDSSGETGFIKIGFLVGQDGIVEHTEVVKATATLSPWVVKFHENKIKGRKLYREENRYQQHAKSDYGTVTIYLVKE